MEEESMFYGQQVHEEKEEETKVENEPSKMRRILAGSIYLWACGEKGDEQDDNPELSDRLLGWLILFIQGFAYIMLIVLARPLSNSESSSTTDDNEDSGYLLASVTGAMYLLVASTSQDLRAGFSLLADGSCTGHRAFGLTLIIVYGTMISAAMTVLVSTSQDSASVVLNAVTVLFIADLDEKALQFLLTVPQKWRLFWAIESIGMSFALALIAITYVGDSSPLLEENNRIVSVFPTFYTWGVNPAALTICSLVLSTTLHSVSEYLSEASKSVDETKFGSTIKTVVRGLSSMMKTARERVRKEPWFFAIMGMWIAQALISWVFLSEIQGFPLAFTVAAIQSASEEHTFVTIDNKVALIYANTILAIGLVAKALSRWRRGGEIVTELSEPCSQSSQISQRIHRWGSCADSRVPSLLVGWGVGYWVTSLLYVLGLAWHGGGWTNAPILASLIGYVVCPLFPIAGVFMVADPNVLGTRFGSFVKPAVDIIRNSRRVEFWVLSTLFRDVVSIWIWYCYFLRSELLSL